MQFPTNVGLSKNRTKLIAYNGILITLALIFSYVESMMPLSIAIPGVKIGVANIVVIIAIYMAGAKSGILVNLARVLVSGFLFSGVFGILYALSGAVLSMAVMVLLKRTGYFSIIGVSVAGGVFHNLGQIIMASFLVGTSRMFIYFPVLIFSGLIFGIVVGALATTVLHRLERFNYSNNPDSRY